MSRVFITGDTHGIIEIDRLSFEDFPKGRELTKDDYVVICGDFGLIWSNEPDKEESYWLNWLDNKPWTTLFVDGNHENHIRLGSYPVEEWHCGKVHRVNNSVIHLMRGQVYNINGYKWFTYGGAESIDKAYRTPYKTWWPQETPSIEDYNEAIRNLHAVNFKVNYVLTHAAPQDILEEVFYNVKTKPNGTPYQLHDFYRICDFKHWYCGHYHIDCDIKSNFHMLYNKIVEINFEEGDD